MSGLIELLTTIGLVGVIWAAGVVLIASRDAIELKRVATRHAARTRRRHA
jgi:hypothetical protein